MKYSDIMTKLSEIQARQEELLNANAAEVQRYEELEAQARGNMDGMTVKASDAFKVADTKAYHEALDEKRHSEDALAMYEAKIEELKKNPLVSEDEYQNMLNTITAETDAYVKEAEQAYTTLLEKALKLRQEVSTAIGTADILIVTAQRKLYRDRCGVTNAAGQFVPMKHLEKSYKNRSLMEALYDLCRTSFNSELLSQSHPEEEVTGIPKMKRWGTA